MDSRQEQELLDRTAVMEAKITGLEKKIDDLVRLMERSIGAWMFVKVLGTAAVGFTIVWAFIAGFFHK